MKSNPSRQKSDEFIPELVGEEHWLGGLCSRLISLGRLLSLWLGDILVSVLYGITSDSVLKHLNNWEFRI